MTVEVYQKRALGATLGFDLTRWALIQPLTESLARLAAPYSDFDRIEHGWRKRHPPEIASARSRTIMATAYAASVRCGTRLRD
jgi:hypothetical protein